MTNWGAIEWFVARLLITAGCLFVALKLSKIATTPTDTSFEAAFTHLFTSEDVAAYKATVLDAVAKPSTRCARPVLRGVAQPRGEADPAFARCNDEWRAVLSYTQRTPEKLGVLERCGATFEAGLRATIQREAACSPHGLGGPEEKEGTAMFVAQALAERARVLADAGDVQRALWLLLEVMRYGQDSWRGRTDLMATMIGTAMVDRANDDFVAILEKGMPSNIDELVTAVDAFIASQPSFGEAAEADGFRVALDWGLPVLEPEWVPPGGARKDSARPGPVSDDARGRAILMLVFGVEGSAKVAQACPAGASLAACYRGFSQPLRVMPSNGTSSTLVRQALVESQTGNYLALWPSYLAKCARSHGRLIALRIQLEVLRTGCADRAALARLASSPALGDAMRLEYSTDALDIQPPAWVADPSPQRVRCTR